jgi:hypothetical protein
MVGTWAVLIACGLLAFTASAQAANIQSLTNFASPGGLNNSATDDSAEFLYDVNNNQVLDVGDVLFGVFTIPTYNSANLGGVGGANSEWTGFFWTKVIDKSAKTGTRTYGDGAGGSVTQDTFQFSFGPDTTGAPWVTGSYNPLSIATGGVLSLEQIAALNLPAGISSSTMMVFFEDKTPGDWSNSGGPGSDEVNSTDGTFFWALGMDSSSFTADSDPTNDISSAGETWLTDTNTFDAVPATTGVNIGSAEFSLNRIFTAGLVGSAEGWKLGTLFNNNISTQTVATEFAGTVVFNVPKSGSTINWPVQNNITTLDFIGISAVPLPAAAWMGFALLGALGLGRRLRRRK